MLGVTPQWLLFGDTTPAPLSSPPGIRSPIAMRQMPNGKAWLTIDTAVPYPVALEVLRLIQENDFEKPKPALHLASNHDAAWLKAELAKPGRSQTGLATALGLDASAVNRMVNGRREIKAKELEGIHAYLAETGRDLSPLAERVSKRVADLGTNAYAVSVKAGLGNDYVRDILRGKVSEPSYAKLKALAGALECTVEDLAP